MLQGETGGSSSSPMPRLIILLVCFSCQIAVAETGVPWFESKPSSQFFKLPAAAQGVKRTKARVAVPSNLDFPPCADPLKGLNSTAVTKFLQEVVDSETSALIVVKDGCTAMEEHYQDSVDMSYSVQSVTKSVASMAIGALIDQGKIANLDMPIATVFPAIASDPVRSKITLRHLLTHTSGIPDWDAMTGTSSDTVANIFSTPLQSAPGTAYLYSSMAAYLLGPIIEHFAQMPADQFIQQILMSPLNIQSATWGGGVVDTGGGLFMSTRDMLKLGNAMLHGGTVNATTILSANWVSESVASSQSFFQPYGLLWWLYQPEVASPMVYDAFSAVGYQGQYIFVYPKYGLIVVRVHSVENTTDENRLAKIFWTDFPDIAPTLVQ